jgi:hypothetical protein
MMASVIGVPAVPTGRFAVNPAYGEVRSYSSKLDVRLWSNCNSGGRLDVDLFPADLNQRARDSIDADGDTREVGNPPGGGVAGLPDENSPNRDNSSPGAMAVTGFKSTESRMQAMGVRVALGSTATTFDPLEAISVPAKAGAMRDGPISLASALRCVSYICGRHCWG